MSLSSILTTSAAAISNSDYQIALANANIANASDTSYSRKTASFAALTPLDSLSTAKVTRIADTYLTKTAIMTASASSHDAAISAALQSYDAALGTVGDGDDVSSLLTSFQTALTALSASPDSTSAKSAVVSSAATLASTIKGLSSTLQSLRTQANDDIGSTVSGINATLDQIGALNDQIVQASALGDDATTLEDQRDAALQTLSSSIGISYHETPDNRVQVYSGGDVLVGASINHLSYTASSALNSSAAYPTQISGVMLNGKDVTTSLSSGKLGGLIQLRDTTLTSEQAKLDSLASTLITQVNAVTNAGAAYPAPSTLTGDKVVAASDAFSATGTLRVAVTNASGAVTTTQDLDLSSFTTVSDLVTALNGISGLNASVSSAGNLIISTANGADGVSLADIGANVSPLGTGVSQAFGLNDMFSGSDASSITIGAALQASASTLPTAALDTSGSLAVGAVALTSGDTSIANRLAAALTAHVSFGAAGDLPAQSASLQTYASSLLSSASSLISTASSKADASSATYSAATTRLENLTSVNTDQELEMLTSYQQQYQANAQMISTVKSLFDTLMTMMSAT